MSDMEKTTEQFAGDLAIASGDLPDTPAGPAPGVPTWRLDYLPVAQALTQAGYGRWKVKPLEWVERNDLQWEHYEAASCFGYYNISRHAERYGYYKPGEDVHTLYPADTLEAAKAACEADHVSRVMGEMEVAPASDDASRSGPRDAAVRWQHVKSGGIYDEIARGFIEVNYPDERVVVYRGQDGTVWVRPESEFDDGRFRPLPPTPGDRMMEDGQDIAARVKRQFPCCGELDSSDTCCAPACTFGDVMNALGKLKYIKAQTESALRGEQDPNAVLRVIKMNCDHALAARSASEDTQREAEGRSQPILPDELVEAAEAVVKWADYLRYFSDHGTALAPVFTDLQAALTLARRTEADIRADERERVCTLLSEEFGNQLDGLDGRDIADWLRSHTQGEE